MTRTLVILTVGRSGSSALAGALHQAGVDFGEDNQLVPANQFNEKGHYEHYAWYLNSRKMAMDIDAGLKPRGTQLESVRHILRKRLQKTQAWVLGIKDVYSAWTLRYWHQYLPEDWRMIVLHRRFDAQVFSVMRHWNEGEGCTKEEAQRYVANGLARLYDTIARFPQVPTMHVQFEKMTEEPDVVITDALMFAFNGTPMVWNERLEQAAIGWIEPALRHY